MRIISSVLFLFTCTIFVSSCSSGRMSNARFSGTSKRTVTFKNHDANQLSSAEAVIANKFLSNDSSYLSKYIEVNYDSVNIRYDALYSNLTYWKKVKVNTFRKSGYRMYADAAGTDHLLDLEVKIIYDTVFTAQKSTRLWDHLWENNNDLTKELVGAEEAHWVEETYIVNHIKFKLRYIDGHSGKTMWRMKCRWPSTIFSSKKQNPALLIKKKFNKKFPYKAADI